MQASSIKKGETLIDTAMTLNAMHPDLLVVRHPHSGRGRPAGEKVNCAVLNAGDGRHEHPTQALLDALTIRREKGRLHRLTIAICGDIAHSRVARSNIHLLGKMENRLRLIGPPTLMPCRYRRVGGRGLRRHGRGAGRRRCGDDAAASEGTHGRRLHPVGARVLPPLRARRREAGRPSPTPS
jgi:aspartate carbamoyltransferase catalytic subunit